jgi:hypothetical protein
MDFISRRIYKRYASALQPELNAKMIDLGWNNSGRIGFYYYIATDMLYISIGIGLGTTRRCNR